MGSGCQNLLLLGRSSLLGQFAIHSLKSIMTDHLQVSESPDIEIVQLKPIEVAVEIVHGLGIAFGLSLLWTMEAVRDRVFRLLDRANVRPRTGPASAFPPGRPRKHPHPAERAD
jgi:hypothetical protein